MGELSKKDIADKALKSIDETFGFNRSGTHKKKCDICGMLFDEPNDLNVLILNGPTQCPECKEIIELQNQIIEHWHKFTEKERTNPIEQQNMIKDGVDDSLESYGVKTETYTLDDCERTFEIIGRTKRVTNFIDRVDNARRYLYTTIEPQMLILESLCERKDLFWKYGGNFLYHVKNACVEFIVIKLKEYLRSTCKYSVQKLKNIISNDKVHLFDHHKVIEIKKFKRSGDIMRTEYPHFEIDKYLKKMDKVLESYSKTINAISDYRDTQFAHIGELKNPNESFKELTYYKLKRIFNSLKIIYDGFYYSIAPDKYAKLIYDHQIWFNKMNDVAETYMLKYNHK